MHFQSFFKKPILSAAALAVGLTTIGLSSFEVEARELRMAVITPPSHVWTKVANRVAEHLPKASNNALSVKVFPAGQLGTEQVVYQQMSVGLVDAGLMTAAITSLRAPSVSGWFTPYLFKDVASAVKATKLPAAQAMLAELDKAGLKGLGYTFAGMRHVLMAKDSVKGPDALQSKKVRIVPFPAMKAWWQAIGAVATPVNLPEVYQAMQSGLLDGIDIDLDALVGLKYQEVGKHLTLTNHMVFPSIMVVSQQTWNSMSEREQKIYSDVVAEALTWGAEQQISAEASNIEALKGQVEIVEIKDGEQAFQGANEAVQKSFAGNQIILDFQEQVRSAQ
jgi:TRAP-type C4-dicarboxylate transport system substrate-binding protein